MTKTFGVKPEKQPPKQQAVIQYVNYLSNAFSADVYVITYLFVK
jgi:hypothetical protein